MKESPVFNFNQVERDRWVRRQAAGLPAQSTVLEHVPEPIKVIQEIARVLKPGGKLLLTAPLGSGIHQEPYHFYGGYTPYWYQKFLTRAGFLEIIVEPNGGFFRHYGQESWRFATLLAPWRSRRQWLWTPFWLLILP